MAGLDAGFGSHLTGTGHLSLERPHRPHRLWIGLQLTSPGSDLDRTGTGPLAGFVTSGTRATDQGCCPSLPQVYVGLVVVKAEVAPRWPAASLDNSYATPFSAVSEESRRAA